MEKLLDALTNINVRKNEGYIFVKREEVIVPVLKTVLSVTKRSFFALPLLDEIVLRLISEGMREIDDLVQVVGISRKLLEVTLADLSVKNIIYCTSNQCSLLEKGKTALRDLKTIQRRKDTIKNVYLDPINQKVLLDYENYQFQDNAYNNDKKLDADFEINNLDVFNGNIDIIKKIFLDEMNIYNDKTKAEPDELVSIDSIEKVFTKFIRIPIYIYVSTTGYDIDILSVNKKNEELLQQFKSEIIDQIRKHKFLKKTFIRLSVKQEMFMEPSFKEKIEIRDLLLHYRRNRKGKPEEVKTLELKIFSDRKLFDEEFEILFDYLNKESEKIEIHISALDELAYREFLNKVLSSVDVKKMAKLSYETCSNIKKSLSDLQKIKPDYKNVAIIQENTNCYFSVIFNNRLVITGVPQNISALDNQFYVQKMELFLSGMSR